jgi:hypothetical protein
MEYESRIIIRMEDKAMKIMDIEELGNVSGGLDSFPDGIFTRDSRNDDKDSLCGKATDMTAGRKYAPSGLIEKNDIQMTALGPDPNIHTS